jgi:hypothetical protein
MEVLDYIKEKFQLDLNQELPISIPGDRMHEFLVMMNDLGLKKGAEIGVSKGRYSKWLFSIIKKLKLFCVDPWAVYDGYVELHDPKGQPLYDGYFEETKKRLEGKNAVFIRKFSMDAVNDFRDNSLDFVFIDGNHTFEYVIDDIAAWSKKVRKGGIISGHDYWNSIENDRLYKIGLDRHEPTDLIDRMKLCQVKDAVNAWTKANQINPWFITSANDLDRFPSWFYIKQ